MRKLILIVILGLSFCDELQQSTQVEKLENLQFLDYGKSSYITFENCANRIIFELTSLKATPLFVSSDSNLTFKVTGTMRTYQKVVGLSAETFINGDSYVKNKKFDETQYIHKGETFTYNYYDSINNYSGHWEIYLRLFNEEEQLISCIKASFDV
jgi:hypothetical protein